MSYHWGSSLTSYHGVKVRVLAKVEPGDIDPGVLGLSTLATEGSRVIVPVCIKNDRSDRRV